MTKRALLIVSAAALFAAGTLVSTASAQQQAVKCSGINSCKGTSSCKTALNSCKGKNSCKGMGWTEAASQGECVAKGGKIL